MVIEEPIEPELGAPTHEFDRYRVLKPLIGILNQPNETELLWLFSIGFGRGRNETLPSDAILECLPTDPSARALWCTKLANQFADVLRKHPNLTPDHPMSEEAMTHILLTSSHLQCANILGDPIWHAYKTLREADKEIPAQLEGALFQALLYNPVQSGESEELYDRLIMGHPDKLFGGTPIQGIHGYSVLNALKSKEPGYEEYSVMSKAFLLLIVYYNQDDYKTAEEKFKRAVVSFAHSHGIQNNESLLAMAKRGNWQQDSWGICALRVIRNLELSDFQVNSPS